MPSLLRRRYALGGPSSYLPLHPLKLRAMVMMKQRVQIVCEGTTFLVVIDLKTFVSDSVSFLASGYLP